MTAPRTAKVGRFILTKKVVGCRKVDVRWDGGGKREAGCQVVRYVCRWKVDVGSVGGWWLAVGEWYGAGVAI